MSTLQIGLAIAGGIVLAGVVAHSTWTSRRNKPRQAQSVSPSAMHLNNASANRLGEPALDDAHSLSTEHGVQEPSFDGTEAQRYAGAMHNVAPLSFEAHDNTGNPAADWPQAEKRANLDALIDVLATLEIDAPISGEAALAAMPATRRVGSKLFSIEGLNTLSGSWETPRAQQRYSAFQTGVQLANRTGPLNEIEFSEFVSKTQAFADVINAAPNFPDMLEQVARARELDHFASTHDAQLSFTLRAVKSAWSPGYVQQNAARLGFIAGVLPGRMVVPASTPGLPSILGLVFDAQAAMSEDPSQSAIYELTLSLDVPQVDRQEEPYARMIQIALELARVMDGTVTDDNGHALSETAISTIARDLLALYDTLDARDLSAGSPQARRLFS